MLTTAVPVLAVTLLALAAVLYRISRNVGPLTLEENARRRGVVLVPVSNELVDELKAWSKPLRMRMERDPRNPVLGELICTTNLEEPPHV